MAAATDVTQTHTGLDRYPPRMTFTFKSASKTEGEREWSQQRRTDKDHHVLSAASIWRAWGHHLFCRAQSEMFELTRNNILSVRVKTRWAAQPTEMEGK